jgi:hypothetical protein
VVHPSAGMELRQVKDSLASIANGPKGRDGATDLGVVSKAVAAAVRMISPPFVATCCVPVKRSFMLCQRSSRFPPPHFSLTLRACVRAHEFNNARHLFKSGPIHHHHIPPPPPSPTKTRVLRAGHDGGDGKYHSSYIPPHAPAHLKRATARLVTLFCLRRAAAWLVGCAFFLPRVASGRKVFNQPSCKKQNKTKQNKK